MDAARLEGDEREVRRTPLVKRAKARWIRAEPQSHARNLGLAGTEPRRCSRPCSHLLRAS